MMGFPDTFRIVVSDTQAYRQFGNSVVVPLVREVARIMMPHIETIAGQERAGRVRPGCVGLAAHDDGMPYGEALEMLQVLRQMPGKAIGDANDPVARHGGDYG